MFARVPWAFLALSCATASSTVAAQNLMYQFTMGVTSPAPVPGKPFTLTWTGGESTEVVYIVLNYYFPDTPNQNIIYETTDILSNAPNNGSWTYNVPLNILAGRHSFSIGYNPFQLSGGTDIFTILSSQTSYVSPIPATTNTAFQSYNGCGLPPVPDYTYTGYQGPCVVTTSGHLTTLYPNVPISDSSSFFGSGYTAPAITTGLVTSSPSGTVISSSSPLINTAFATGVFAQALQCPTPVAPSPTSVIVNSVTTVFSTVGCATASGSGANSNGVCHASGYTTFSVSGTSSVCCPNGWATTPLDSELFCFTSLSQTQLVTQITQRGAVEERQGHPLTQETIIGLAFTSAGVVTSEAAVGTGSSSTSSATRSATGSAVSAGTTNNSGGVKLDLRVWGKWQILSLFGLLFYLT